MIARLKINIKSNLLRILNAHDYKGIAHTMTLIQISTKTVPTFIFEALGHNTKQNFLNMILSWICFILFSNIL